MATIKFTVASATVNGSKAYTLAYEASELAKAAVPLNPT